MLHFGELRTKAPLSESSCRVGISASGSGRSPRADEHMLLTPFGSKRSSSTKRLLEESKWMADLLQTVRGLPWNPIVDGG